MYIHYMTCFRGMTFVARLLGACVLSTSMAWAQSAVSEENIVMEKIIYTDDDLHSSASNGVMKVLSGNTVETYVSGERYFPVILVETADFKALDSAFMARMFNEEGFKDNGVFGSVRDYYIESSGGQFKPTFDIYPVKLPKNFSEYNSISKFVLPSIDAMVERSDFASRASKYGTVIPFIILHPTSKEKAKEYNNYFYNHMDGLKQATGKIYSKNGYSFNKYAFVSQKAEKKPNATSTKDVAMLGAFIHEFCHVMGLSDLYSNDANDYATIGPLPFDVMALGLRNGNGGYPPTFSAFERESMGWLNLTEILNNKKIFELKNLSGMQAYAVSNPKFPNEYYIIEYRPAVGFDSKLGQSSYSGKQGKNGVFIWYIDYNAQVFNSNDPNKDVNHQRAEVKTVLTKNGDSFTEFEFIRNNGTTSVEGIFNIVFDGNDRVCFTVNRMTALDQCPSVSSSSSSVESSSSSSETVSLAQSVVRGARVFMTRGNLNVEVPVAGQKTLRFYDALGNVIKSYSFTESSASVDISGWNRPAFVRLDVNGRPLLAKRVSALPK